MKRRTVVKILALSGVMTKIPLAFAAKPEAALSNPCALASIRLYNPTQWSHPTFVEVPTGQLAAPGLIDWRKVRLACASQNMPFSLREGRAHRKATLAPVPEPRAEDLIVFTATVPPDAWLQFDVVSGRQEEKCALTRQGNKLVVSYPNLKVFVDQTTGMLMQVEAFSEKVLAAPMSADLFPVEEGVIDYKETPFLSYSHPKLTLKRKLPVEPFHAKLVSSFSDAALTELNFTLESGKGPAIALTYRVHPSAVVEIWADERPWDNPSPWLDYGVEYGLNLVGENEQLPVFETQYPFYGFPDYASVLKNIGRLHRVKDVAALEVGEESVNGRRWNRCLYFAGKDQLPQINDMVQLVDEGLVVEVVPMSIDIGRGPIHVSYPDDCKAIAEILVQTLRKDGVEAESSSGLGSSQSSIVLKQIDHPHQAALEGDGFAIQRLQGGDGVSIVSGTRFGLMIGALKLAEHVRRRSGAVSVPLIASNPGVDLRAGGFGGAPHEVDFPYESDDQWTKVFDDLIASGMNTMTCLGMWGNWKMPVTYKYMPELKSDSPEAYDEISGTKFSEFGYHRERGQKLLNYLRERGVKVWLWIPVGAIPTTFAEKFPDAVLPSNAKVPRVLHPKYQQYLRAFFKEVLEVYPVDGFVLIRDDNGGMDTSEEFQKYLAASRTKQRVWEQELMIYELLRSTGFRGDIAIYPYREFYKPELELGLPQDLFIVGHGSGFGTLTRSYQTLGPMGDTWLDNLYTAFRLPPTGRIRRLIADRGAYWIGGAFRGTELPWEAVGAFAWQPTETANTLRHQWGSRAFGKENGLAFIRFADNYERLWEILNRDLLPGTWMKMSSQQRQEVERHILNGLKLYRKRLIDLTSATGGSSKDWFAQVALFGSFFEYTMRRLQLFAHLYEMILPYKDSLKASKALPPDIRSRVASIYREMLEAGAPYANEIKKAPGGMMRATEPSARVYKEWDPCGYGPALDETLGLQQFSGTLTAAHDDLRTGHPFTLTLKLYNSGICPWVPSEGQKLQFDAAAKIVGLPLTWNLNGEWVLPGDSRELTVSGTAPSTAGTTKIRMRFWSPSGPQAIPFLDQELALQWE